MGADRRGELGSHLLADSTGAHSLRSLRSQLPGSMQQKL